MRKKDLQHWIPRVYLEGFCGDGGTHFWAAKLPNLYAHPKSGDTLAWSRRGPRQVCCMRHYHAADEDDHAIDRLVSEASEALHLVRETSRDATLVELVGPQNARSLLRMLLAHRFRSPYYEAVLSWSLLLAAADGESHIADVLLDMAPSGSLAGLEALLEAVRGSLNGSAKRQAVVEDCTLPRLMHHSPLRCLAFEGRRGTPPRSSSFDGCVAGLRGAGVWPEAFTVRYVPAGDVWTTDNPFSAMGLSDTAGVPLSRHHWLVGSDDEFSHETSRAVLPRLTMSTAVFSPVRSEMDRLQYGWETAPDGTPYAAWVRKNEAARSRAGLIPGAGPKPRTRFVVATRMVDVTGRSLTARVR